MEKTNTLLLIHGYPFDHHLWDGVKSRLSPQFRVLCPDLAGFGDNPAATVEPSIDRMADDLAQLLDLHSIPRATVVGMSLGGYVALAFAERHANRMAGLGLISTQTQGDDPPTQQKRRDLIARIHREGTGVAAEAILEKLFSQKDSAHAEKYSPYVRASAEKAGIEGLSWALEAMARRPDRSAVLKSVHVPMLILHGGADQLIPVDRVRSVTDRLPASFVMLPNAGHATPLEEPDRVAQELDRLVSASAESPLPDSKQKSDRPGVIIAPDERGL